VAVGGTQYITRNATPAREVTAWITLSMGAFVLPAMHSHEAEALEVASKALSASIFQKAYRLRKLTFQKR